MSKAPPGCGSTTAEVTRNIPHVHFPGSVVVQLNGAVHASDAEIVDAMKLIWKHLRIVMEPSSAVPLATILKNPEAFAGKRVGIIVTGGNVDLDKLPWI